jgi:hypothetical protein
MLTRRYKPIIKVQAILVLKPPNNVKKLRHFLGILPWHVSKAWQNAGPSLNEESVEKCQSIKQHLTMSIKHLGNGTSLSRLHEALMIYTLPPLNG